MLIKGKARWQIVMKERHSRLKRREFLIRGAATTALAAAAAPAGNIEEIVAKIRSKDDAVRGPAWQSAGPLGAPAVKPLAEVMLDTDMETSRAAKRALWLIVRHAGRPNAQAERKAVSKELVALLPKSTAAVRREMLWMLSEIGDDDAVPAIAELLQDAEAREDARMALERIPGKKATQALAAALKTVPEDFRPNLAHSLRVRGEKVTGYPTRKLVPTKQTTVKQTLG
jgi:HEAT repeat protein